MSLLKASGENAHDFPKRASDLDYAVYADKLRDYFKDLVKI